MNSLLGSGRPSILYIHSGETNKLLVESIFKYDYGFSDASEDKCLPLVVSQKPDMVILELDALAEARALEMGRKIRKHTVEATTGLIYLSNDGGNELRFKCYGVGADDFITIPFDVHELHVRIELILKSKSAEKQVQAVQDRANKLVSMSLCSIGEQGVVLNFVRNGISIATYPSLAQAVFDALATLNLSAVLAIWRDEETGFYGGDSIVNPIEVNILEVAHEKFLKKIVTFDRRCLIMGKQSTLLIRKLPDDLERAGRYKDMLAMLVDSLDLICNQILLKSKLIKSEMQLTQSMLMTNQSIGALKFRTVNSRKKITRAMENLVTRMEQEFMTLGLTEDQEHRLIKMVLNTEQVIGHEIDESLAQEEEMNKILELSGELRWQNSR